jgi:Small-conductance mechanosensitive channel
MASLSNFDLWDSLEMTIAQMVTYFFDHLSELIFALIILSITAIIAKIIERRINKYSENLQKKMRGGSTRLTMMKHLIVGLIYLIGLALIFYTIPELRSLSSTLLASVGVLGLILGIAAQDTFGNIISGIALVFFQPFRVGDLITVGSNYGRVTDINLRQTTIMTSDDRVILIPNSVLNKETVINWTYEDTIIRWSFTIQITNDSNLDKVRRILVEEAQKSPYVLSQKDLAVRKPDIAMPVRARVSDSNGDFTAILLEFWVNDRDNAYSAEYEIREGIKRRFDAEESVSYSNNSITVSIPNKT